MFNYYIIHNLEKSRKDNKVALFSKFGINHEKVTFINSPNKNELTYEIKKNAVQKKAGIKDGWISCSYKHFLAFEQIVKNDDEYAVVMEDNIGGFYEDVPTRLMKYLSELPDDWDIVFDSVWGDYSLMNEEKISEKKLVYKKNNFITKNKEGKIISHGGTRAAQFYFVNRQSAKIIYENFLPFNHSADMWMNEVLRNSNLKSFLSAPSLVTSKFNSKTSTNLSYKDFPYFI